MTTKVTGDEEIAIPTFDAYLKPVLAVLKRSGGPASNQEIEAAVIEEMKLAPSVTRQPHNPERGRQTEVAYRMAWARTYLAKVDLIANVSRGVWAITDKGRSIERIDAEEIVRKVRESEQAHPAEARYAGGELQDFLADELQGLHAEAFAAGKILSFDLLKTHYANFSRRFGPQVLAGLDGENLLELMHGRGRQDSLVYWLEFKNDDEFPDVFGSISGGSALKFGIYKSADTGEWMSGSPSAQIRLSKSEAIEKVRRQRDQMVAGCEVLASFRQAAERNYGRLQQDMLRAAPEIAETAWGHKYFALLFFDLLDDYHAVDYQQFHLKKLLRLPGNGRYENAGHFAAMASQLEIPINHLAAILNIRNGSPHAYWRVGTTEAATGPSFWDEMVQGGFVGIHVPALLDLSDTKQNKEGRQSILHQLEAAKYHSDPATRSRKAGEIFHFVTKAAERDIVVATIRGQMVVGIGVVTGDYYYEPRSEQARHRRPVRWLNASEWPLPVKEGLLTTFIQLKKAPVNQVAVEERLLETPGASVPPRRESPTVERPAPPPLDGVLGRIEGILGRKRQVILYGPPGTGKSYWAHQAGKEIVARSWFQKTWSDLEDSERQQIVLEEGFETCCFHPAYGYEDFLEGYRPAPGGNELRFELRDGIFKRLCQRATQRPQRRHVLFIDEINRGDLPRIFGELLLVLEKDKRGQSVILPVSGERLVVPDNVYIIAAMNTADRSVALLDAAFRRRFGFLELMPDSTTLKGASVMGLPLAAWLNALNRRILKNLGKDARNLQIGHSYLMAGGAALAELPRFVAVLREDIIPLIEEYCYNDYQSLEQILGNTIVRAESKRIDETLFAPERHHELVDALLKQFSEIAATAASVEVEKKGQEDADDGEPDDGPLDETNEP